MILGHWPRAADYAVWATDRVLARQTRMMTMTTNDSGYREKLGKSGGRSVTIRHGHRRKRLFRFSYPWRDAMHSSAYATPSKKKPRPRLVCVGEFSGLLANCEKCAVDHDKTHDRQGDHRQSLLEDKSAVAREYTSCIGPASITCAPCYKFVISHFPPLL